MVFQNLRISPLFGRATFDILDTDLAIVNGIRRVLLSEIPTIGFLGEGEPTIDVYKNTGPLHNELIIHRIGMIPLHFTEEDTEAFQEGLYEFSLFVENTKDVMINVTTHDFVGTRDGETISEKELKTIFPVNNVSGEPILITRLRPGEAIGITARPIKSTARHHAAFSPISMCSMRFIEDPAEASKTTNILDKERAFIKNQYNEPTAIEFSFEIENGGAMKDIGAIRYLVSKALDVIIGKIEKAIDHDEAYVTCNKIENGFEFVFENEDDTLGNILQSLMFNRHVREQQPFRDTRIGYVGYTCPHPLDPTMVLKVMFEDKTVKRDVDFAWALLMDNCSWIKSTISGISNEWLQFIQLNSLPVKGKDNLKDKGSVTVKKATGARK
ncbi:DNA-directed RNA polymerase II subunit RPB3 [Dishui Lake large algae virus 1]|nr:DNA-directed RNA polymerase II subunit RPB3 [Dishui Lake large algae virus 1]